MLATKHIALRPLWDGFGAIVEGIDLAESPSNAAWREVLATLHEHQVLKFPGQEFTFEQFDAYGRRYGEPIPHVLDHFRVPGWPAVMTLTNTPDRGEAIVRGAAFWHTDQSYEAEPSSATTLYAVRVPRQGGGTFIADMFTAYDDLSDSMKQRLDGLVARHLYGNRDAGKPGENDASPLRNAEQASRVPACEHRIVRPHPVTGRKALYGVAGTSRGIVGIPEDEALDLLGELKAHALQEKYVRRVDYQPGDAAVWDTSSTLHCAEPIPVATGEEDERLMWRISVRGRPPLLKNEAA